MNLSEWNRNYDKKFKKESKRLTRILYQPNHPQWHSARNNIYELYRYENNLNNIEKLLNNTQKLRNNYDKKRFLSLSNQNKTNIIKAINKTKRPNHRAKNYFNAANILGKHGLNMSWANRVFPKMNTAARKIQTAVRKRREQKALNTVRKFWYAPPNATTLKFHKGGRGYQRLAATAWKS